MLRKTLILVAAVLATLALAETALRLAGLEVDDRLHELRKYVALMELDAEGGYFRHPRDASFKLWGAPAYFNSLGMRDREPELPKPAGRFRILLLGDSIAVGQGVTQDDSFPYRIRDSLSAPSVDIVTAAVAGWNTSEQRRFLETEIDRLEPDLVVLLYVRNDRELDNIYRREMVAGRSGAQRWHHRTVATSRLYEWGTFFHRRTFYRPSREALQAVAFMKNQLVPDPFARTDRGWLASRNELGRINVLLRRNGTDLAIFLYDVGGGRFRPPAKAMRRLSEFGKAKDLPVYDTSPFFAGQGVRVTMLLPLLDPHLTPRGNQLMADGVIDTLCKDGFLPSVARCPGPPL